MDHDMLGVPIDMANQSSCFIDGVSYLNNQEHFMSVFPILSTMEGSAASDLYARPHMTNQANSSFGYNNELQEQLTVTSLLSSRSTLQNNLSSLVISPPLHPFDVTRTHAFDGYSDYISFANPTNCGYDAIGNVMDSNGWSASIGTDHPYGSSKFSNELSLSLATTQSSVHRTSIVPDQCSNDTGLGSEQNSYNSKEVSLSNCSQKPSQFSQATHIIQEILAQIASYSLENVDQMSYYSTDGMRVGPNIDYSSTSLADRFEKRSVEVKKTELLTLLQVVDDRYNQCIDEIHTVVSAFHAVTELDPQKHGSFALRTISCLYKSLRERISNQILSMGAELNAKCTVGKERSFEASFVQKQWALQQQKRKEHQLWRPERGLPEKSVAVLRAWMFQNFLHPYPKDAEKHLLAVKSGLSRNQVSNWFINARVRLWKPMIEEMYSEMNKRKASDQYQEGSNKASASRRGHRSMNSLRSNMN